MSAPRDSELQEYLEGRSRLSSAYRTLEKIEPPSHLDDQVLRQASREQEQPRLNTPWGRKRPWLWGTIAASAILAFSLVPRHSNLPPGDRVHDETAIRTRAPAGEMPGVLSEPDTARKKLEATLERHLKVQSQPEESVEMRDPEAWLAEIAALEQQGHAEAARRQLEAFRRQYPDYVSPSATQPR